MSADSRIATPPIGDKTRAAGPCEVTQYKAGKVVRHYVIPSPGDEPQPLAKVAPMNRAQSIAAGKGIDQSLVSPATHAKRRNRTFTAAGAILSEHREVQK